MLQGSGSKPHRQYSRFTLFACLVLAGMGIRAQVSEPIRWAAVGASIVAGSGYPAKLQTLLGPAYKVENEGVSGTTMLRQGDFPYWKNGKLPNTFAFKPHIISIDLGGNDAKPQNWNAHKNEFIPDYKDMIDTLGLISTKPLIIPCTPQPSFQRNGQWPFGINNIVIRDEIIPLMKSMAADRKLQLADTYTNQANLDLTSDGVHPDPAKPGADSIAVSIYRAYKTKAIRLACIGNSITDNGHNGYAYPIRFNQLLGSEYYVLNAGHSGRTLLRNGDFPYITSNWFKEVFAFKPNIITIKLGTNDSKPQNWDTHKNEFVPDLRWLVDTLQTISPKPRIILLTPIPAWKKADGTWPYGINGDIVKNEVVPKIKLVAQEKGLALIDLHTPFLPYQTLTTDGVHPTEVVGLDTLAHMLFRAFKSLPPPVSVLPEQEAGRSEDRAANGRARLFMSPEKDHRIWGRFNPLAPFGTDASGRRE